MLVEKACRPGNCLCQQGENGAHRRHFKRRYQFKHMNTLLKQCTTKIPGDRCLDKDVAESLIAAAVMRPSATPAATADWQPQDQHSLQYLSCGMMPCATAVVSLSLLATAVVMWPVASGDVHLTWDTALQYKQGVIATGQAELHFVMLGNGCWTV